MLTFEDIMNYDIGNPDVYAALLSAYKQQRIVPFIGAGMSVSAGFPAWNSFLNSEYDYIGWTYNKNSPPDQLNAASKLSKYWGEAEFRNRIRSNFGGNLTKKDWGDKVNSIKNEATYLLPKLFNGVIVTTNFERLLEHLYPSIPVSHPGHDGQLNIGVQIGVPIIFKLHGCVSDPHNIIFTQESYNLAYNTLVETDVLRALRKILTGTTLLFLGCSLTNDRTVDTWKNMSKTAHGVGIEHFAITHCQNHSKATIRSELNSIRPILYDSGIDGKDHDAVQIILQKLLDDTYGNGLIKHNIEKEVGFCGRDNIILDIHNKLQCNGSLFVTGMPGIGKTELVRAFASDCKDKLTHFIVYSHSLKKTVCSLKFENDHWDETDIDARYKFVVDRLISCQNTIIIIDNFEENEADKEILSEIQSINLRYNGGLKFIFTTRNKMHDHPEIVYPNEIVVPYLSDEDLIKLFKFHCPQSVSVSNETMTKLLIVIEKHTLTLVLVAGYLIQNKIVVDGDIILLIEKLNQAIKLLDDRTNIDSKKDSIHPFYHNRETCYIHIRNLILNYISKLDENQRYILSCLSTVPVEGLPLNLFKAFAGISTEGNLPLFLFPDIICNIYQCSEAVDYLRVLQKRNLLIQHNENIHCHKIVSDVLFCELTPNCDHTKDLFVQAYFQSVDFQMIKKSYQKGEVKLSTFQEIQQKLQDGITKIYNDLGHSLPFDAANYFIYNLVSYLKDKRNNIENRRFLFPILLNIAKKIYVINGENVRSRLSANHFLSICIDFEYIAKQEVEDMISQFDDGDFSKEREQNKNWAKVSLRSASDKDFQELFAKYANVNKNFVKDEQFFNFISNLGRHFRGSMFSIAALTFALLEIRYVMFTPVDESNLTEPVHIKRVDLLSCFSDFVSDLNLPIESEAIAEYVLSTYLHYYPKNHTKILQAMCVIMNNSTRFLGLGDGKTLHEDEEDNYLGCDAITKYLDNAFASAPEQTKYKITRSVSVYFSNLFDKKMKYNNIEQGFLGMLDKMTGGKEFCDIKDELVIQEIVSTYSDLSYIARKYDEYGDQELYAKYALSALDLDDDANWTIKFTHLWLIYNMALACYHKSEDERPEILKDYFKFVIINLEEVFMPKPFSLLEECYFMLHPSILHFALSNQKEGTGVRNHPTKEQIEKIEPKSSFEEKFVKLEKISIQLSEVPVERNYGYKKFNFSVRLSDRDIFEMGIDLWLFCMQIFSASADSKGMMLINSYEFIANLTADKKEKDEYIHKKQDLWECWDFITKQTELRKAKSNVWWAWYYELFGENE